MRFPPLPPAQNGQGWSSNVSAAHRTIRSAFQRALDITALDLPDPYQIQLRLDCICKESVPMLEILAEEDGIPDDWVQAASRSLMYALEQLERSKDRVQGRETSNITYVDPVKVVRSGKQGRPRMDIDEEFLREAMSSRRNISVSRLSSILQVSRHTIMRRMKLLGIKKRFAQLTNAELDKIMKTYKKFAPKQGIRFARSHLHNLGFHVQKHRVSASLKRVDAIGNALRKKKAIKRRKYYVKRPNHLWHCDGHHKLIRWGIVIHGFIDGFCRTVTGLRASNNNLATTVEDVFHDAIAKYGIPRRVRGDRGGENMEVAVTMVILRGHNTAAFIWGSSTRNTRIERLWVDLGIFFVRQWHVFFVRLERMHHLDASNPEHLWLIHYLFLPKINQDCERFQIEWNMHAVSGPTTNNQTPQMEDMRMLGMIQQGINNDPCDKMSIEEIEDYYGCFGKEKIRRTHETGAGHDDESEDSDDGYIEYEVDGEDSLPAVKVKSTNSPFPNDNIEKLFRQTLRKTVKEKLVPHDFGVLEDEWEDGEYPTFEVLQVGKKRSGETIIPLPQEIWLPRAKLWVMALAVKAEILDFWNLAL